MTSDPRSDANRWSVEETQAHLLIGDGNFSAAIEILELATARTHQTERLLAEARERLGDTLWFHDRVGSSPHYRAAMEILLPRGGNRDIDRTEALERQEHWTRISEKLLYGTGPDGRRRRGAIGLPHPNGPDPVVPPPEPQELAEVKSPQVHAPSPTDHMCAPKADLAPPITLPMVAAPLPLEVSAPTQELAAPREDPRNRGHLKYGFRYRVAQSFRDFDDTEWLEGTVLTYQGSNYFPYDEGLTLFTEDAPIRLCGLISDQERIMSNLKTYLVPVDDGPPDHKSEPR
jgi:hypothetical protein